MTENFNLCHKVLKELDKAKVLDKVVLIGSWAYFFYQDYFNDVKYRPLLRTRDVDFLVPIPLPKWEKQVDVPALLEKLGFATIHNYSSGVITLSHPQLIVEFLVPEQGKGSNKPLNLPDLKINAQRIRFLNYLLEDMVVVEYGGLPLHLPQPARFALHKVIVASRRTKQAKAVRDIEQVQLLLEYLFEADKKSLLKALHSMPRKWANLIFRNIDSLAKSYPDAAKKLASLF